MEVWLDAGRQRRPVSLSEVAGLKAGVPSLIGLLYCAKREERIVVCKVWRERERERERERRETPHGLKKDTGTW